MNFKHKNNFYSRNSDGLDVISWKDLINTIEELLDSLSEENLYQLFGCEIEGLEFLPNRQENKSTLDYIQNEIFREFKEPWDRLSTTSEQNHFLRKQLIQFAETWMSHQCYFEIGDRHVRDKIFTLLKDNDPDEYSSVSVDFYEEKIFEELLQAKIAHWLIIVILRKFLDDAHEHDFPSKFNFSCWRFIESGMQLLSLEDSESEDALLEKTKKFKKSLEIEKKILLSFWDWRSRDLFEKGYNIDMLSNN